MNNHLVNSQIHGYSLNTCILKRFSIYPFRLFQLLAEVVIFSLVFVHSFNSVNALKEEKFEAVNKFKACPLNKKVLQISWWFFVNLL